jgi:hypothetical protein
MERIKQWAGTFIVALALAVLLTRFAGVGTESADAAAPKEVVISPYQFVAYNGNSYWYAFNGELSGTGYFQAAVPLPAGKKITGITIHAYDNHAGYNVCASVYITHPMTDSGEVPDLDTVCTSSASLFRAWPSKTWDAYKLQPGDIAIVRVDFQSPTYDPNLKLHGVAIQYK